MPLSHKFSFVLSILAGLLLGSLGLLTGVLEMLALIDPIGTRMADDSDPFGDPYISPLEHAIFIILTLAMISASIWLLSRACKPFPDNKS